MKAVKRKRLEAAGWRVGAVTEFLNLSPEESVFVEDKIRLSHSFKRQHQSKKLPQAVITKKIKLN